MTKARDLAANATGSAPAIIDAKGDLIAGTAADAAARLAVGTDGYLLSASSGESTGLAWTAPPSSGGMTVLASGTLSGTVTLSSISQSYINLNLKLFNPQFAANSAFSMAVNGLSAGYTYLYSSQANPPIHTGSSNSASWGNMGFANSTGSSPSGLGSDITFPAYSSTVAGISRRAMFGNVQSSSGSYSWYSGTCTTSGPITSISFPGSIFTGGTYVLYGVK